jgi:cytochrome c
MASSLEGNKILAAVLTAGIIASGSGVLSRILYAPHELEEPALKVALPAEGEAAGGGEAAEPSKPLPELLASADAAAGEGVAKKCQACHSFEQGGPNKVGPDLWGVVGRPVASHGGFSYSSALAGLGGNWDYDRLNQFIADPKAVAPGTKMTFAGIKKDTDRANLLAYLQKQADSPVPFPGS